MPITYCRDCVYCVVGPAPAANTSECMRHPPKVVVVDGAVEQWRPFMRVAEDFCGDGEAKEAEEPAVLAKAGRGDPCYTADCPGRFYQNEADTCNCSQLTPRQTCIGCMLVCNKCGRAADEL